MASSESKGILPRVAWCSRVDLSPSYLSTSPFIQEIICQQCRRRQLPDLIASLPVESSSDEVPRSAAIDIPGIGGGGRLRLNLENHSASSSPESIGQELRRIGDDFDRSFGSNGNAGSLNTSRSRSLSFLQQLPRFSSRTSLHHHRRKSTAE